MEILSIFRAGIPPPQPIFQEDMIIIEINKRKIREKRLGWWDSNREHVSYFNEQEDIILIKYRGTKK